MSKRLEILKASLKKKEAKLQDRFDMYFDGVKQANGQPLNDKRNGRATLNKWERNEDAIRTSQAEVQKTKNAIEREEGKIMAVDYAKETLPQIYLDMMEEGILKQWRKHPNTFFVVGVDKARIVWNEKEKVPMHRYSKSITDKGVWRLFAKTYNRIVVSINESNNLTK